MSHTKTARTTAAATRRRLRDAGVPPVLSCLEAWNLSGGIVGRPGHAEVCLGHSLARLVLLAPDAEAFLDHWREVTRP